MLPCVAAKHFFALVGLLLASLLLARIGLLSGLLLGALQRGIVACGLFATFALLVRLCLPDVGLPLRPLLFGVVAGPFTLLSTLLLDRLALRTGWRWWACDLLPRCGTRAVLPGLLAVLRCRFRGLVLVRLLLAIVIGPVVLPCRNWSSNAHGEHCADDPCEQGWSLVSVHGCLPSRVADNPLACAYYA